MKQLPKKIIIIDTASEDDKTLATVINRLIDYLTERDEKEEECGFSVPNSGLMDKNSPITVPCQNPKSSCPLHGEKKCPYSDCWKVHYRECPIHREKIKVVVSDRIDYCSQCGKEHGYDCPLDTLTTETMEERFDKTFMYWTDNCGLKPAIKFFITSELSLQKARLVEAVEGEKQVINPKKVSDVILEQEIKYINEGLSLAQEIISEDK